VDTNAETLQSNGDEVGRAIDVVAETTLLNNGEGSINGNDDDVVVAEEFVLCRDKQTTFLWTDDDGDGAVEIGKLLLIIISRKTMKMMVLKLFSFFSAASSFSLKLLLTILFLFLRLFLTLVATLTETVPPSVMSCHSSPSPECFSC
jgi:hypothetical protein